MQIAGLLQPLLAQLNSGVLVLDAEYRLVFINQFIARRANLVLAEVQGQLLFDVFTDLPRAWLQRKLDSVQELQIPAFSNWEQRQYIFKLPHLRPLSTGSQYMAQNCSIMPLSSADNNAGYICILIEDATDAFVYQQQLHNSMQQLEQANRIDGLTGIFNRRYWQQQLQLELQRATRYQHPLSLLLFDLDKFKQLNDTYGHQGGDAVLMSVSQQIATLLRDTDIFGRYGGEEFGVILPETALSGAMMVANRVCQAIASQTVSYNQQHIAVTLSIGVASFTGQSVDELIQQTDIALYNAKRQGRNCVRAYASEQNYLKKVN
ncbi:MAG: diguanylate cyclase [Gammaproteobacteria bacterium]|nr:diguanylate cyclase [Gammaproteobacteria bacterium]MBU1554118.1 diguanylate cyclase [Gammaproteobacteria bacterium]MBU2072027.1 diguanylate cyclase [Gammaproteobacteria bacterium]MBU2183448.1 diguanylate cyclase [Gammaproteobacteria bacterium]MBU2203358.1 diguanylate cyclase [Gammaproteobacteria bacterium]